MTSGGKTLNHSHSHNANLILTQGENAYGMLPPGQWIHDYSSGDSTKYENMEPI